MINQEVLQNLIHNDDYVSFLNEFKNHDINALRLKKFKPTSFDTKFAILQIECKNKIKKKLPDIYHNDSFLFPNTLSTEQCTAQPVAKFHASLFNENDNVLDLTAGLCIDTLYISKRAKHVTALEINPETAAVSQFNMNQSASNVKVINCDCTEFIANNTAQYDAIFIDPARRGDNNKRLFGLSDCVPNVIELIPQLRNMTKTLYIKASPMIDIIQSVRELNSRITDVWAIGINNECKELLFKVDMSCNAPISEYTMHTINYENGETQMLSSLSSQSHKTNSGYASAIENGLYLYEPNRCIMKAGIFDAIETAFDVTRIQQNSHLFISSALIPDFPGRKFIITDIIPFKGKSIKNVKSNYPKINVSTRNFKLNAEELKRKLSVSDGGDKYLFGTTDKSNNAILIICDKAF